MTDILTAHAVPTSEYRRFLDDLLALESGIRPDLFDWYVAHFDTQLLDYPVVRAPGRAVRDAFTGAVVRGKVTVREYFWRLGVLELFDVHDRSCLRRMQYGSTNALGFIGYQFGEKILMELGYYRPQRVTVMDNGATAELPRYYTGGLADHHWIGGRTAALIRSGEGPAVLATDVNEWAGSFTGKGGVWTLNDLRCADKQEALIAELVRHNHGRLQAGLGTLARHRLSATATAGGLTLSGLLAAAHLCGVDQVLRFLHTGAAVEDEFGTSLLQYLQRFSGYRLPLDEPLPAAGD